MDSCAKHPHERGAARCGRCGAAWCNDCLIYSFGPKKPPYCISCAMFAGGVRTSASRPAMPKRQLKALQKSAKAEAKAAAKESTREPDAADTAAAVEVEAVYAVPARTTSDWETPWWEDRQPTFAD